MKYGHEVWLGAALTVYLRNMKGLSEADAAQTCERMLREAKERFAPLYAAYEDRKYVDMLALFQAQIDRATQSRERCIVIYRDVLKRRKVSEPA